MFLYIYTENKIIAIANEIFNDCIILEKSTAAFSWKFTWNKYEYS